MHPYILQSVAANRVADMRRQAAASRLAKLARQAEAACDARPASRSGRRRAARLVHWPVRP